jgi:O-antigen ligase
MRNLLYFPKKQGRESTNSQSMLSIVIIFGLVATLLVLFFTNQIDLLFAILHLLVIGSIFVRAPVYGVLLLLALSTTTGFFNRLALFISGEPAPLDFIRAALEIVVLFMTIYAFNCRLAVNHRKTRLIDNLVYAYFIICTIYTFNILYAPPLVTIWGWRWVVVPIMLYFVGRCIGYSRKNIARFYQMLSLLLLILSSYAVYQAAVGLPGFEKAWFAQLPGADRAASIIEGSIFLAGRPRLPSMTEGYVTFTILAGYFFLMVLLSPRRSLPGMFSIIQKLALLMTGLYLFLTLERSAIAMIAVGITVVIGLHLRLRVRKLSLVIIILLGGIGFTVLRHINTSQIPGTINTIALRRLIELANPLKASTVQGRAVDVWPRAWQRFRENPFGYGLGTFHMTSQNQRLGYTFFFAPHNNYFLILLETGVVGLLIFLLLILRYIRFLLQAINTNANKIMIKGAIASLSGILAVGFFNIPIDPPVAYFFWFTMGLFVTFLGQEYTSNGSGLPLNLSD